uniref:Uncharacterized protein n=1 Tax=Magallana gigas TaxID=29159 RepID=K1R2S0_MAGGI
MFAMHEVHSASSDANKYNYRRIPNNIIETFAVDAISDIIYFVDSSSGSLKKHDIISRKTSTIASVSSARGTCQILNGGCGELCVPEENGRRCECDIGLQLQPDQSCDSGFAYADRLAIDYSTGNLYYTAVGPTTSQSYIGVVHRSTSLHKTLIYNLHSPRDIALYPSKGRITKINKLTGLKVVFMSNHPELGRLDSLDIYADEIQDVSLSCLSKNGFCSTFCFPTPTGRTCGCQDNVNLQADQVTCHGAILCPVSMNSVVLSPNCSRRIRDSCSFSCIDGYRPTTSTTLVCTADGTWNRDTNTLCSRTTPEEQTGNSAYVYAGLSAAGVVVLLVTVVIGIYCLKKRRDNSTRNPYEGHHISNESSGYTTFGNGGYDDYRYEEGAVVLIDRGCDVHLHDKNSVSPFEECLRKNLIKVKINLAYIEHSLIMLTSVLTKIVNKGEDVNAVLSNGEPPVCEAVKNASKDVLSVLIKVGKCNVNTVGSKGESPLFTAAKSGYSDICRLLLDAGADPDFILPANQHTPLITAASNDNDDVIKVLLKHGCNVNHCDVMGKSALWHAYSNSNTDSMKLLLRAGSDKNIPNAEGQTLLDDAKDAEDDDVIELLTKFTQSWT